jgi:hypothetical protein|uniref:Portal protein n=1 Tax=Myoviridae sp. cteaT5 TaxID=2826676 RepID=A0A8S5NQQ7_9CAUD|nr:MAG TPA: portal protein [Myoviridae sp. cteaT5]
MAILTNMRNSEYELLHDAYYGTGMFAAGGALQKHPRESAANYTFRQKLSYYLNHTAPIINACVDPIFKDTISRDYNESELFETFLNDVDRLGTTLQEFMRYNATQAKVYGVMYVLVDNVSEIGETVADQVNNRQLPYLVAIEPKSVYKWLTNDIGELEFFSYTSTVFDDEGQAKTQYHEWTRTSWTLKNDEEKIIATGEHNLGKVPIVQWFGRSSRKIDILPPPEYLAIARTNHQVYHLCSLLTQILNMQTFSTLTLPDNGQGVDDITLGTNNVLMYPAESSHAPAFIAPDRGPAEIIMSVIKMLVDDMYRLSGINSVIGVQEAKSGVAKQWDFERTNQRLADFSVQCESAEKDIIELFELWTNMNVDYKCDYPREFKINDITDSLAQSQAVLDLGLGSNTLKVETGKKVLDSYMPNIESETFDEIVAEIEESVQRQEQDETYHNNNDDEVEGGAEDEDATRDKQGDR